MSTPLITFSYRGTNLGDDMQTLAAMELMPPGSQPAFVERDSLGKTALAGKLLLNGWWTHDADNAWPPPQQVDAMPVAMHIAERARSRFTRPDSLRWLHDHQPIGARDVETLAWLESLGIDAYWSGCLTLGLQRPDVPRGEETVIVDLPPDLRHAVAGRVHRETHRTRLGADHAARRAECRRLLAVYAAAKLVVTKRLHCALPCVAIGTPVVLVGDCNRFAGFESILRIVPADAKAVREAIDAGRFTPGAGIMQRFADTRERCREFLR